MARQYGLICLALGLFMMVADDCQAQMRIGHQLVHRPFRALGHGTGPGIHHCNPGPDVGYYNPWSHKNSFLISKSPEFLNRFGHESQRSPMHLLHSYNSPYSHQPNAGAIQGTALPMNAEFVPSVLKPVENDADDNRDESSSSSDEVDDRFDEEVDEMEEVGGFGSLKDNSEKADSGQNGTTASEGASLLHPSDIFLPASHPVYRSGQ